MTTATFQARNGVPLQYKAGSFKFASTQFDLPPDAAKAVLDFGKTIPDADLAESGREDQIHATLKYGLHDDDPSGAFNLLGRVKRPVRVKFGKLSLFTGGKDGDVLKIDVDSPDLHALNKLLSENLEHTDTHPAYNPHVTVAYLRPGRGSKYAGKPHPLEGKEVELSEVLFSAKDKAKHTLRLGEPAKKARNGVPRKYAFDPAEEAGFHAKIKDDPTARRVYADWLDEHDEPEHAALMRATGFPVWAGHHGPVLAANGYWVTFLDPGAGDRTHSVQIWSPHPGDYTWVGSRWPGEKWEWSNTQTGESKPPPEVVDAYYDAADQRLRKNLADQKARPGAPRKYAEDPEAGFHAAMHENGPADMQTPLVYADWLEDHGKSAWAALIRHHVSHYALGGFHHPHGKPFAVPTAKALRFGDGRHEVSIQIPSKAERNGGFAWAHYYDDPDEAASATKSLVNDGAELSSYSDPGLAEKVRRLMRPGHPKRYAAHDDEAWHAAFADQPHEASLRDVYADELAERGDHAGERFQRAMASWLRDPSAKMDLAGGTLYGRGPWAVDLPPGVDHRHIRTWPGQRPFEADQHPHVARITSSHMRMYSWPTLRGMETAFRRAWTDPATGEGPKGEPIRSDATPDYSHNPPPLRHKRYAMATESPAASFRSPTGKTATEMVRSTPEGEWLHGAVKRQAARMAGGKWQGLFRGDKSFRNDYARATKTAGVQPLGMESTSLGKLAHHHQVLSGLYHQAMERHAAPAREELVRRFGEPGNPARIAATTYSPHDQRLPGWGGYRSGADFVGRLAGAGHPYHGMGGLNVKVFPLARASQQTHELIDPAIGRRTLQHGIGVPLEDPASVGRATAHELGHAIEQSTAHAMPMGAAFLRRRHGDSPRVPLRQFHPHYADHEFGRAGTPPGLYSSDSHPHVPEGGPMESMRHYLGKTYHATADPSSPMNGTELLSTGLEEMYRDPHHLAREDPELFDHVIHSLRATRGYHAGTGVGGGNGAGGERPAGVGETPVRRGRRLADRIARPEPSLLVAGRDGADAGGARPRDRRGTVQVGRGESCGGGVSRYAMVPPHEQMLDRLVSHWKGWTPTPQEPTPGLSRRKDHFDSASGPLPGYFHDMAAVLAGSKPAAVVPHQYLLHDRVGRSLARRLAAAGHAQAPLTAATAPGGPTWGVGPRAAVEALRGHYGRRAARRASGNWTPANERMWSRAVGGVLGVPDEFSRTQDERLAALDPRQTRKYAKGSAGRHGTPGWNPKPEPGVDASKRDADPLWQYHRGLRGYHGFPFAEGSEPGWGRGNPTDHQVLLRAQSQPSEPFQPGSVMEGWYGTPRGVDLTHTTPAGLRVWGSPEDAASRTVHDAVAGWGFPSGPPGALAMTHAATLPAARAYWDIHGAGRRPGWAAVSPLQDLENYSVAGDPYGLLAASVHSGNRHAIGPLVKLLRERDNPAGWSPVWSALHRDLTGRVGDLPPEEVLRRVTAIGGETRHASHRPDEHWDILQHAIDGFTKGGRDLNGFHPLADHMEENGLPQYAQLMRLELQNAHEHMRPTPPKGRRFARRRYAREVPVSELHPEIRFTRLGAVLRHLVRTGDHADPAVGMADNVIQSAGPHDGPMELAPLHVLRDYMLEHPDHPLATKFNWEKLPEKVALDRDLNHHVRTFNAFVRRTSIHPSRQQGILLGSFRHGVPAGRGAKAVGDITTRLMQDHPWATLNDIDHSSKRLMAAGNARFIANHPEPDEEVESRHADSLATGDDYYPQGDPQRYARETVAHDAVRGTKLAGHLTDLLEHPEPAVRAVAHGVLTGMHSGDDFAALSAVLNQHAKGHELANYDFSRVATKLASGEPLRSPQAAGRASTARYKERQNAKPVAALADAAEKHMQAAGPSGVNRVAVGNRLKLAAPTLDAVAAELAKRGHAQRPYRHPKGGGPRGVVLVHRDHAGVEQMARHFARVPDAQVHADFRPTGVAPRVGSALQMLAAEHEPGRPMLGHQAVAEHVLRTGETDGFHALADALQERDHPAKDWFDWPAVGRGMAVDRAVEPWVRAAIRGVRRRRSQDGSGRTIGEVWAHDPPAIREMALKAFAGVGGGPRFTRLHAKMRQHYPDLTTGDLWKSLRRLYAHNQDRRRDQQPNRGEPGDPTHYRRRYARVPAGEVHADFRPDGIAPRLGHALRILAAEEHNPGDVNHASIAEHILRRGETHAMPILADALDDVSHPMAGAFDWRHAPRAIAIDKALHGAIETRHTPGGHAGLSPGWVVSEWRMGGRQGLSRAGALAEARQAAADATMHDVNHSIMRLLYNHGAEHSFGDRTIHGRPISGNLAETYAGYLTELGTHPRRGDFLTYPNPNGRRRNSRVGQPRRYSADPAEGEAIVRAIADEPGEHSKHLVYADWLEENGNPAVAHLIRDSVAHADENLRTSEWSHRVGKPNGDTGYWSSSSPDGHPSIQIRQPYPGHNTGEVLVSAWPRVFDEGKLKFAWSKHMRPDEAHAFVDGLHPKQQAEARMVLREKFKYPDTRPRQNRRQYARGDEAGFHAAIKDDPTARWVYADWLDDHGHQDHALLQRALGAASHYPPGSEPLTIESAFPAPDASFHTTGGESDDDPDAGVGEVQVQDRYGKHPSGDWNGSRRTGGSWVWRVRDPDGTMRVQEPPPHVAGTFRRVATDMVNSHFAEHHRRQNRRQYARVGFNRIHPEIRGTKLAGVLNRWQHENPRDPATPFVKHILAVATKGHDQPLDLSPFAPFSDFMQEHPDHPLAKAFNWADVPKKLALDRDLKSHIERSPGTPLWQYGYTPGQSRGWPDGGVRHRVDFTATRDAMRAKHPGVTDEEIASSASRLQTAEDRRTHWGNYNDRHPRHHVKRSVLREVEEQPPSDYPEHFRRKYAAEPEPAVQYHDEEAMRRLHAMVGRLPTPHEVHAAASGVPGGLTRVYPDPDSDHGVKVVHTLPDHHSAVRYWRKNDGGELESHNESIHTEENSPHRGGGFGRFRRSVDALRGMGFRRMLIPHAAGYPGAPAGHIGYHVWPKFGFAGRMSGSQLNGLHPDFRDRVGGDPSIRKLYSTPGGAEYWKRAGSDLHNLHFDLHPESENSRAMEAYARERAARAAKMRRRGSPTGKRFARNN